jgi:YfiH family protein
MGFYEKDGLRYYQFDIFMDQPIFHAIMTRHAGFSKLPYDSLNTGGTVGDDPKAVLKNHQKIYQVFGLDYFSRLDVWQVHGTQILCGEAPRDPETPHIMADGILTNKNDITLFMRFADCVPILLWDPVVEVIGIAHAGWQGTSQKITQGIVEKMVERYGSDPKNILAAIGPSICQDCYEVGTEVKAAFDSKFGKSAERFFRDKNGRLFLDLWKANQQTLKNAGVEKIEVSEQCTACHIEDWYSYRAENGRTGRFGVLMKIQDQ